MSCVAARAPDHAPTAVTGIGLTILACALLAGLDCGTKFIGQALPILMVVWLRFMAQALVTTALVLPQRGLSALRTQHPKLQCGRALSGSLTTVFAFYGIQHMPLANFTALWAVVPLLIVVASAALFHEKVHPLRWGLLVLALSAVVLIVRPEQAEGELGWLALMPVGMLLTGTSYQLLGSRLAQRDAPTTTQLYSTWLPVLVSAPCIPWIWHSVPSWHIWLTVLAMGLCSGLGHLLLLQAYAYAPPSTVSPFLYSQIGFAMLLGWLLFGQQPDALSVLGIGVILLTALGNLWLTVRAPHRA